MILIKQEYIKSPLNYVGGKYKLLPQILPLFPKNIDTFIDLFGGGFNVGINVPAKEVVYNDLNLPVVQILEYIHRNRTDKSLDEIDEIIKQYDLSKINRNGYLRLRSYFNESESKQSVTFGIDITPNVDFLTYNYKRKFDNIITNPPFKFAKEFILRSLDLANEKVIMFAKIQLLEGQDRLKMWENTPIKTIYVFSKRVNPMRNGSEVDEKGKPWASTMCFAWFVWEHNYEGLPTIEWI